MQKDLKSAIKGLATGIGSLPYEDAAEALDLIFKYCPEAPFWPQLPKRDNREGMVSQFSENIPCIHFENGVLKFSSKDKERELEAFYERIISGDISYFRISPEFSSGIYKFYQRLEKADSEIKTLRFIKCHVTGPFTFAASINDESGASLLRDKVFMQIILKAIAMKALWQINMFKGFGKKIILFLDEPYLGCFGSGFTPINREQVIEALSEFVSIVKSKNVLIGVHCCGNTDWSIFTEVPGIDIINFDAFSFIERIVLYSDNLKEFFKRGGILCWGIVPTQENITNVNVQILAEKIEQGINALLNKGLDKNLVVENLSISPACGLGMLSIEKAKEIFRLLSDTSSFIKRNF